MRSKLIASPTITHVFGPTSAFQSYLPLINSSHFKVSSSTLHNVTTRNQRRGKHASKDFYYDLLAVCKQLLEGRRSEVNPNQSTSKTPCA
jgi:hypothetical protein